MPKNKVRREKKQRRGRPEIPGRRVVVKLEEAHIKRASELGEGNVAAGIRQALAR
jgi:type III secretory pathway component EscU